MTIKTFDSDRKVTIPTTGKIMIFGLEPQDFNLINLIGDRELDTAIIRGSVELKEFYQSRAIVDKVIIKFPELGLSPFDQISIAKYIAMVSEYVENVVVMTMSTFILSELSNISVVSHILEQPNSKEILQDIKKIGYENTPNFSWNTWEMYEIFKNQVWACKFNGHAFDVQGIDFLLMRCEILTFTASQALLSVLSNLNPRTRRVKRCPSIKGKVGRILNALSGNKEGIDSDKQ